MFWCLYVIRCTFGGPDLCFRGCSVINFSFYKKKKKKKKTKKFDHKNEGVSYFHICTNVAGPAAGCGVAFWLLPYLLAHEHVAIFFVLFCERWMFSRSIAFMKGGGRKGKIMREAMMGRLNNKACFESMGTFVLSYMIFEEGWEWRRG